MSTGLAIDCGGIVSDLVLARNCCLAKMLPGEVHVQNYALWETLKDVTHMEYVQGYLLDISTSAASSWVPDQAHRRGISCLHYMK